MYFFRFLVLLFHTSDTPERQQRRSTCSPGSSGRIWGPQSVQLTTQFQQLMFQSGNLFQMRLQLRCNHISLHMFPEFLQIWHLIGIISADQAVPGVSCPGMINSLPMVSRAKCRPAQPPPVLESRHPQSSVWQFDFGFMQTYPPCLWSSASWSRWQAVEDRQWGCRTIVGHDPNSYEDTQFHSVFGAHLDSDFDGIGDFVRVFADIGNHMNFNQMALCVILDAFAASTLHRYLTCISKFLSWCRESGIAVASVSVATFCTDVPEIRAWRARQFWNPCNGVANRQMLLPGHVWTPPWFRDGRNQRSRRTVRSPCHSLYTW